MTENQSKQNNLVETTDCLEAIGVFRGWKNFLFVIVALCLLLLQISFWLVDAGYIKVNDGTSGEFAVAAANNAEDTGKIEEAAKQIAEDANQPAEATAVQPQQQTRSFFGINALLILTSILYCLTMLFSLKISLIGRLGGINHICRAFFLSLVMLVLLVPWQKVLGFAVVGAIYTPSELVKWSAAETNSIFGSVVYYLRFTGYWLLVMLLLILSQLRSVRWTKAILRRLEII
jgi:hypothetical protein